MAERYNSQQKNQLRSLAPYLHPVSPLTAQREADRQESHAITVARAGLIPRVEARAVENHEMAKERARREAIQFENEQHEKTLKHLQDRRRELDKAYEQAHKEAVEDQAMHLTHELSYLNGADVQYPAKLANLLGKYPLYINDLGARQRLTAKEQESAGPQKKLQEYRNLNVNVNDPAYRITDASGWFHHMDFEAMDKAAQAKQMRQSFRAGENAMAGKITAEASTLQNEIDSHAGTPAELKTANETGMNAVKHARALFGELVQPDPAKPEEAVLKHQLQLAYNKDDMSFFNAILDRESKRAQIQSITSSRNTATREVTGERLDLSKQSAERKLLDDKIKNTKSLAEAEMDEKRKKILEDSLTGLYQQLSNMDAGVTSPPSGDEASMPPAGTKKYIAAAKGQPVAPASAADGTSGGIDFRAIAKEKAVKSGLPIPPHIQAVKETEKTRQKQYRSEDAQTKQKTLMNAAENYKKLANPEAFKTRVGELSLSKPSDLSVPDSEVSHDELNARNIARKEFDSAQKGIISQLISNGVTDATHHSAILDTLNNGRDFSISYEGADKPGRPFIETDIGDGKTGMRPLGESLEPVDETLPGISPVAPPLVPVTPDPKKLPDDLYQPRD